MVEFIASQTSVLQSLVSQLNHRPQKDDDQHVTLNDGSRVKKVSIERSQSVLLGRRKLKFDRQTVCSGPDE